MSNGNTHSKLCGFCMWHEPTSAAQLGVWFPPLLPVSPSWPNGLMKWSFRERIAPGVGNPCGNCPQPHPGGWPMTCRQDWVSEQGEYVRRLTTSWELYLRTAHARPPGPPLKKKKQTFSLLIWCEWTTKVLAEKYDLEIRFFLNKPSCARIL